MTVSSPCINICQIHPGTGLCVGCKRSMDEIIHWGAMTESQRRAVMDALALRANPDDRAG